MMKKKVADLAAALVITAALALSGCASGSSASSQAPAETTASETGETVSSETVGETTASQTESSKTDADDIIFAYNGSSGNLLAFVAQDKGYFDEEGLNVEFVEFNSTGDGITAMNAGKVDASFSFGSNSPLQYISEGSDLVFIGGYVQGGHPIVTLPENADQYDISDKSAFAKSFVGKSVGILRLYTSQIVWENAMLEEGIDIENDLTTVEFKKPADLVAAVRAGQVDVGVITNGSYTMAVEAGLSIVGYSHDLWPGHVCCRGIVTREYYEAHKTALTGLLKALLKAQKDVEADKDYAVSFNAKLLGIDEETSRNLLYETGQTMNTDPNRKGILDMYQSMIKQGLIENEFDVDSYIDVDLYKDALDQLLEENPGDEFYEKQLALFEKQDLD